MVIRQEVTGKNRCWSSDVSEVGKNKRKESVSLTSKSNSLPASNKKNRAHDSNILSSAAKAREALSQVPRAMGYELERYDSAEQKLSQLDKSGNAEKRSFLLRQKGWMLRSSGVDLLEQRAIFTEAADLVPYRPAIVLEWLQTLWASDMEQKIGPDWSALQRALQKIDPKNMVPRGAEKLADQLKGKSMLFNTHADYVVTKQFCHSFMLPSTNAESILRTCSLLANRLSMQIGALASSAAHNDQNTSKLKN